jgi:hypothetical protein
MIGAGGYSPAVSEVNHQVVHYSVEVGGRRYTTTRQGPISSPLMIDPAHHDPQMLLVSTERIRAVGEAEAEVELMAPVEQLERDPEAAIDVAGLIHQLGSGGWVELGESRGYDPDVRLVAVTAHQAIWLRALADEPHCQHQVRAIDGPVARAAMRDVAQAYYAAPRGPRLDESAGDKPAEDKSADSAKEGNA